MGKVVLNEAGWPIAATPYQDFMDWLDEQDATDATALDWDEPPTDAEFNARLDKFLQEADWEEIPERLEFGIWNMQDVYSRPPNTARRAAGRRPIIQKIMSKGITGVWSIAAELARQGIPTPRGAFDWPPVQVQRSFDRDLSNGA